MKFITAPSSALALLLAVAVAPLAAIAATTNFIINSLQNADVRPDFSTSQPTVTLTYSVDATSGAVYTQAFSDGQCSGANDVAAATNALYANGINGSVVSGTAVTVTTVPSSVTFSATIGSISSANSGTNTLTFCHHTMSSTGAGTLMYERYTNVNIQYTINNGFTTATAVTTTAASVAVTTATGSAGTVGVTATAAPTTVAVGQQFTVTLVSSNTNFVLSGLTAVALNTVGTTLGVKPIIDANGAILPTWSGIVTTSGKYVISVTLPFEYYTAATAVTMSGTVAFAPAGRALAEGSDAPVAQPFQVEIGLEQVSKDGASAAFVVKSIVATGTAALVVLAL
jgi:hypothetical protein